MKTIKKNSFINYFYMILGTFFITIGLNVFLVPSEIVSGGISGISVILYHTIGISPDVSILISNIPLLGLSLYFLGKKYTLNTIFCAFLLPVFIRIFNFIPQYSGDIFIATIFGGVFTGTGAGLIFKAGSSSGGTAILQQIIHDKFKIPLGTSIILIDGLILLGAFYFFDVTTGLYSTISLFIIGKTVDIVQSGGTPAKTALIISNKTEFLTSELMRSLQIGATLLKGQGAYSKEKKDVLLCTFPEKKIVAVKSKIFQVDPNAFCIVVDAKEVIGNRWESFIP
ncbi:YitT family protein [Miniphocaeibacter halophilus]|uniref:YitT family protein n=1 Tax=Miniphocaeibacter halophilus TaxID=2931922 RepID=A0AC61MYA7_9FIRM|nr:YitT family protein [Miniphocaeibacter halophilus]QQK08344.1 YitT family protein [Miniphocaeibacter halophilus]